MQLLCLSRAERERKPAFFRKTHFFFLPGSASEGTGSTVQTSFNDASVCRRHVSNKSIKAQLEVEWHAQKLKTLKLSEEMQSVHAARQLASSYCKRRAPWPSLASRDQSGTNEQTSTHPHRHTVSIRHHIFSSFSSPKHMKYWGILSLWRVCAFWLEDENRFKREDTARDLISIESKQHMKVATNELLF